MLKNLPANAGDAEGSVLGLGRSPGIGNSNLFQYSLWRIPWTEEPKGLQCLGSKESDMPEWQSVCTHTHTHTHTHIHEVLRYSNQVQYLKYALKYYFIFVEFCVQTKCWNFFVLSNWLGSRLSIVVTATSMKHTGEKKRKYTRSFSINFNVSVVFLSG